MHNERFRWWGVLGGIRREDNGVLFEESTSILSTLHRLTGGEINNVTRQVAWRRTGGCEGCALLAARAGPIGVESCPSRVFWFKGKSAAQHEAGRGRTKGSRWLKQARRGCAMVS